MIGSADALLVSLNDSRIARSHEGEYTSAVTMVLCAIGIRTRVSREVARDARC